MTLNNNPFTGPKLHLYKKNASRRIKTSSATRNFNNEGIFPNFLTPLIKNFDDKMNNDPYRNQQINILKPT
jgi:hypothetical protein